MIKIFYTIAILSACCFIVVSENEQFLQVLRRAAFNINKKLTQTQINDLDNLKNFVIGGSDYPNIEVNSEDSLSISPIASSAPNSYPMAIIKYMQRKLGFLYPFEIALNNKRCKFSDDCIRLIVVPCKAVVDALSSVKSILLLKKYPKELEELKRSEKEMYNALIYGQICFYLLEVADLVIEKSFQLLIKRKTKSRAWFENMSRKEVESNSSGGGR